MRAFEFFLSQMDKIIYIPSQPKYAYRWTNWLWNSFRHSENYQQIKYEHWLLMK